MKLDIKKEYTLGNNNYYNIETEKKRIVIGNTLSDDMNHINRWENRMNGKYKFTSPYTILKNGVIYEHYNPIFYSNFIGVDEIDRENISIVLENQGWLIKDSDNNCFINWVGDIYNKENEIIESRWRNHRYWDNYTTAQMESLTKLCRYLCKKFGIPLTALGHNTKCDYNLLTGVVYRSNYSTHFKDVSPAFDFITFKNNLEFKQVEND